MHLQHEKKMYPPRVKMTVILKNKEDAIVPVKFLGCSSDSQLDIDLPFPLYIGNYSCRLVHHTMQDIQVTVCNLYTIPR